MAGEISARSLAKFDGNNFKHWKFQITAALIANDLLLDLVTGERVRPAELNAGAAPAVREEAQRLLKAWIKDDAKAMYLMAAAMEPEQMENLIMCTSSKVMWDRLATIHEQRSASHKRLLSQRFHEYRMEPTATYRRRVVHGLRNSRRSGSPSSNVKKGDARWNQLIQNEERQQAAQAQEGCRVLRVSGEGSLCPRMSDTSTKKVSAGVERRERLCSYSVPQTDNKSRAR